MKKFIVFIAAAAALLTSCNNNCSTIKYGEQVVIDEATMMDKIKGGWFGQTIGCTYGGPTEFKYKGGIIWAGIPIPWFEDYIYDTFIIDTGIFDG